MPRLKFDAGGVTRTILWNSLNVPATEMMYQLGLTHFRIIAKLPTAPIYVPKFRQGQIVCIANPILKKTNAWNKSFMNTLIYGNEDRKNPNKYFKDMKSADHVRFTIFRVGQVSDDFLTLEIITDSHVFAGDGILTVDITGKSCDMDMILKLDGKHCLKHKNISALKQNFAIFRNHQASRNLQQINLEASDFALVAKYLRRMCVLLFELETRGIISHANVIKFRQSGHDADISGVGHTGCFSMVTTTLKPTGASLSASPTDFHILAPPDSLPAPSDSLPAPSDSLPAPPVPSASSNPSKRKRSRSGSIVVDERPRKKNISLPMSPPRSNVNPKALANASDSNTSAGKRKSTFENNPPKRQKYEVIPMGASQYSIQQEQFQGMSVGVNSEIQSFQSASPRGSVATTTTAFPSFPPIPAQQVQMSQPVRQDSRVSFRTDLVSEYGGASVHSFPQRPVQNVDDQRIVTAITRQNSRQNTMTNRSPQPGEPVQGDVSSVELLKKVLGGTDCFLTDKQLIVFDNCLRKLFVRKIDPGTTDIILRDRFQAYGDISSIKVVVHKHVPAQSGFAIVEFSEIISSTKAAESENNSFMTRPPSDIRNILIRSGYLNSSGYLTSQLIADLGRAKQSSRNRFSYRVLHTHAGQTVTIRRTKAK